MQPVIPDYSGLDFNAMAAEIGIKPKYILLLVTSYVEESEEILASLFEAIASKNYEAIQHNAHSIKGSSGNLRLNELYEMAKAVEFAAREQRSDFAYDDYYTAIAQGIKTIAL